MFIPKDSIVHFVEKVLSCVSKHPQRPDSKIRVHIALHQGTKGGWEGKGQSRFQRLDPIRLFCSLDLPVIPGMRLICPVFNRRVDSQPGRNILSESGFPFRPIDHLYKPVYPIVHRGFLLLFHRGLYQCAQGNVNVLPAFRYLPHNTFYLQSGQPSLFRFYPLFGSNNIEK